MCSEAFIQPKMRTEPLIQDNLIMMLSNKLGTNLRITFRLLRSKVGLSNHHQLDTESIIPLQGKISAKVHQTLRLKDRFKPCRPNLKIAPDLIINNSILSVLIRKVAQEIREPLLIEILTKDLSTRIANNREQEFKKRLQQHRFPKPDWCLKKMLNLVKL